MYCVVEYIDYKKEQSIEFHGCSDNEQKAIEHAVKLTNDFKEKYKFDSIIDNSYEFNHSYLHILDNKKSKVIKEFRCVTFEKLSDDKIKEIINDTDINITIKKFIISYAGKIDHSEYKSIENELLHNQTVETIRKLLEYLSLKCNGNFDIGPEIIDVSAQIFAVVRIDLI